MKAPSASLYKGEGHNKLISSDAIQDIH